MANTSVIGKADTVTFKTTGKEILEKGWRVVFDTSTALGTGSTALGTGSASQGTSSASQGTGNKKEEKGILPTFVKGEKGPHKPSFLEKETKAPKYYTEATLLRAMETAGKQVDDDEMRELMKENGIGRPSTRANIIETLFRRKYIVRKKKQIIPTDTGVRLIDTIQNKLLKSAELTGRWEKQLKEIEKGDFHAGTFIRNMKKMVDDLVYEVRTEKRANISAANTAKKKKIPVSTGMTKGIKNQKCPKCKNGTLLKGKTAYGCSDYKNGCDFRLPFSFMNKKISENQFVRLLQKGCTVYLKGFKTDQGVKEGLVRFDENYHLILEEKKNSVTSATEEKNNKLICPKCKKGTILKGKTAYGCSDYKNGCDFVFSFDKIREIANGEKLTKFLVYSILNGKHG